MTPGLCLEDHRTAQGLRRRAVALRIAVGAEVLLHVVGGIEETYSFLQDFGKRKGMTWMTLIFKSVFNDDVTTLLIASTPSNDMFIIYCI